MSTEIPKTMTAYVLTGHGGMEQLELHDDWPVPVPKRHEVLIKVGACGLNNTDVNTRSGWYSKAVSEATTGEAYETVDTEDPAWGGAPIHFPRIQGADVAGRIVATGSEVDQNLLGQRVITDNWLRDWDDPLNRNSTGYFGSECNGGFAQYTTIDYRNAGVIQSQLSDAELATFSCSYSTAEGMLDRAELAAEDTILVTGASGGVGSALIQLAKRRGATVIGMASIAKHPQLIALGANHLIDRNTHDLRSDLQQVSGQSTVSVVADVVGGNMFTQAIDVLERGGRYTCSGAIAGPMVNLDLRTLYLRDLTFTGSTVIPPQTFRHLLDYIEKSEIQPVLAKQYPLEKLTEAQQAFIDKQHVGNIVVTMQ